MLKLEVLVRELGAVDALAASAVAPREVAALNHEVLDDTVEGRTLVAEVFLSGSEGTEVLSGLRCDTPSQLVCLVYGDKDNYLWHRATVQTHHNTSHALVAMLNVEINLLGDFGALRGFGGLREVDEAERQNDEERDEDTLNARHLEQ